MAPIDLARFGRAGGVDLSVWPPRYDPTYRPPADAEYPAGIYGRFDDMLIVRGENVYPSAIEDTLRALPGFGGEFRVIVSRNEAMDELLVQVEYAPDHAHPTRREALRTIMRERLRARLGIHPVVELVPPDTLPRTEFKARRVVDDRDLYRQALHAERSGAPGRA